MNILEKNIEDLIYQNSLDFESRKLLIDRGLHVIQEYDFAMRQVNLGSYGILDLMYVKYYHTSFKKHKEIEILIMEIKKDEVNINTFLQASRYARALQIIFKRFKFEANIQISLIGKTVCKSDFCYLPDVYNNLSIYTYSLDLIQGLKFKDERGYCISDPKKIELTQRTIYDFKNYIFEEMQFSRDYEECFKKELNGDESNAI